jgi:transcription elongation GreA/GreB family factor
MTDVPEPLSPDTRRALEQELSDLRTEREAVAVTLRGTDSDASGDSADQADELQRATETARLDTRIAGVTERLSEAAVAAPPRPGVVGVGSSVTVRFADGTTESVQIGEVAAEADSALATADSPLGRALLGRGAGDTVTYDPPEGGPATAVVVSVGSSPSAA